MAKTVGLGTRQVKKNEDIILFEEKNKKLQAEVEKLCKEKKKALEENKRLKKENDLLKTAGQSESKA